MKKNILVILVLILSLSCVYAQEVKVSKGTLSVDGCLWIRYRATTDTVKVNTFTRANAFLGLTANLTNWAACRYYFDLADTTGKPAYDLFALLKPISYLPNLTFTFGQFKLPLGIEVLTKAENLEFIQYSLIGRDPIRTPKGTRDIGFQVGYKHPLAEGTIALVNGQGRNVLQDVDNYKNFAGRLIIKPLPKPSVYIGVHAYLGRYVTDNFFRIGAELNYTVSPIIFKAEFLNTKDGTAKGSGYYTQMGYNWSWLQPIFRYSAFKYTTSESTNEFVLGLNCRLLADNLKIILNYKSEKINRSVRQKGILTQLQIAF